MNMSMSMSISIRKVLTGCIMDGAVRVHICDFGCFA